jgi:hypothetical protein
MAPETMTPEEVRKLRAETEGKPLVEKRQAPNLSAEEDEVEEKSEEAILFPELEIDGYTIRPWTLGKLRKVNPCLERVLAKLENKGIKLTLDNIEDNLLDLYFAAVDEIITILSISLDVEEQELESIPIPQAIRLIFLIYKQNEDSIKNVSSLLQMTSEAT